MTRHPERAYESTQYDMSERDRLIMEELPQVHYIASRIKERLPQNVDLEDLVNAGVLGLIEAVNNYDSSKPVLFKTFAKFRIRGAIVDSLRALDWGSRSIRRKGREIDAATSKLEMELGRQPSEQEIANELKIDLKALYEMLFKIDGLFLVSQQVSAPYDRSETHDLIESAPSKAEDAFDICLREENSKLLAEAISELDERSERILSLYYREELTMKEIALVLDIAESRVSQIHSSTLLRIRRSLSRKSGSSGASHQPIKKRGSTTWARS